MNLNLYNSTAVALKIQRSSGLTGMPIHPFLLTGT